MNRWITIAKVTFLIGLILGVTIYYIFNLPPFGGNVESHRFENNPPQQSISWLKTIRLYMQGQKREPQIKIPVLPINPQSLNNKPSIPLTAIWFGHSTVLIELQGIRIMTDPILSTYASPFSIGPKRFHVPPISLNELDHIDAVVISHDHYDHLDMKTILHLASKGTHFYLPIGLGSHLKRWRIPAQLIHEMNWWQFADFKGVKIYCTPARHYSGRRKMDNSTLWSSWFIKGNRRSVFFSGDTGYAPHFLEIRKKLGPANLTLMKIGAYGDTWKDIHMTPEEAVQAQMDLDGKVMLPVHWATFNLAYHAWDEPILRTLEAAKNKPFTVITPRVGEEYEYNKPFKNLDWYAIH